MADEVKKSITDRGNSSTLTIATISTDELSEEAKAKKEKSLNNSRYTSELAAYIRKGFEAARTSRSSAGNGRSSVDTRIIESRRQVNCIYDTTTLNAIQQFGGCKDYDPLTIQKCLVAESWIKDIMSPADDKPWTIDPSPIPDLPDEAKAEIEKQAMEFYMDGAPEELKDDPSPEAAAEIEELVGEKSAELRDTELQYAQEESRKRAKRMEQKIYDQLVDGDFMDAFDGFLQYLCRSLVGIIKGPVYKNKKALAYQSMEDQWSVAIEDKEQQYYYAPDPQNVYFSPSCLHQDTGDVFEIMPFQSSSIQELIGVTGYNDKAIEQVMSDHQSGGLREWTNNGWETQSIENRPQHLNQEYNAEIDAIDYWGKVPGEHLIQWGLSSTQIENPSFYYDVHAILIGTEVILSELNPDKLGRRPYHITSFEKQANSIYGRGIPEKVRPAQKAANMTRRALINNVAIASGPQVMINSDAVANGEVITAMHAWKIWQYKFIQGMAQQPVSFFQPDDNSESLSTLLEKFYNDADRDTGIPRYIQGDQAGAMRGAAGTMGGLGMLMNAASKSMKRVLSNVDTDIFNRVIQYQYDINMRDPNIPQEYKGDFNIRTKGSLALAVKEQLQQARAEFMQTVLNSKVLFGIVKKEGVVTLLREITKGLDMPTNFIPSNQAIENESMGETEQQVMELLQAGVENGIIDEQQAQLLVDPEAVESELDQPAAAPPVAA